MKKIYLSMGVLAGCLISCTTDIERPVVIGFGDDVPKNLTISSEEVMMEGLNESAVALELSWEEYALSIDNPEYKIPDKSVRYYIELSSTAEFEEPTLIEALDTKISLTENQLTAYLIGMGYEPWKKAPLHLRIRYALSDNIGYRYSEAVEIIVMPYGIRNNRMDMLATDKETVLFSLYSPEEDGIYSGYVGASNWMNFYLIERNGTMWGSEPDAGGYVMSKDALTMWNLWFPEGNPYSYYVKVDVNKMLWEAKCLHDLAITSSSGTVTDMKFKVSENTWTANVSITGAETFTATAWTWLYGKDNQGTDGGTIEFGEIVTIPQAGNWTISFDMSGLEPKASYSAADTGGISYEPYLEMIDPADHSVVKSRLFSPENDGVYKGFYYAAGYENFYFATTGRQVIYGSDPTSQYELSTESGKYNLWMPTEAETFNLYTVSLPDNSWSYTTFSTMSVAGEFNGGNTTSDPMTYDKENKVWTADLEISTVGWGLQILLDGDWGKNFKHKEEGVLGYLEGSDILPPGTGKYRLTVDLFDMGHLTYKFESIE